VQAYDACNISIEWWVQDCMPWVQGLPCNQSVQGWLISAMCFRPHWLSAMRKDDRISWNYWLTNTNPDSNPIRTHESNLSKLENFCPLISVAWFMRIFSIQQLIDSFLSLVFWSCWFLGWSQPVKSIADLWKCSLICCYHRKKQLNKSC